MSETVQAWIDIRRMREMSELGWRLCGPAEETCVLMEGPDPDQTGSWRQIVSVLCQTEEV